MPGSFLLWWPLVVSAFWCSLASAGPASAASAASAAPAADARGWMVRMQSAARDRNYQGTMVFTAGDVVSSSRVGHFCVGEQSFERIEALDGRQERVYRHNDLVHSFWPQSRIATAEVRDAVTASPALPDIEPRLQAHYELRVLGGDRIAGRQAQVLLLKPRDELRFAQRLWADAETGLMLRADVIGPQGGVLESSAFSDIEIGGKPQRESILVPMKKLDGYRVVKLESARTQLETEGWVLKQIPAGFNLVGCVRRPIALPTPESDARAPQVLQALFSDGLSRVSIFIEPYDASRPRQALLTQLGATHTLMKPRGDRWWVTVMGDVPALTLKQFDAALERRP
jgi:sigma-E factor negative regulatory protein RseB